MEDLQLINEAIINEAAYRKQIIELGNIIRLDSTMLSNLRVKVLSQSKLLNDCDAVVDKSRDVIESNKKLIDELNSTIVKEHRKKNFNKYLVAISTTAATTFALLFFLSK